MKICITGSFGSGDIGDDAMLTAHLKNIYGLGLTQAEIVLAGTYRGYTSWYWHHPRENCILPKDIKDLNHKEYTFLLITGGGTINTRDDRGGSLKRMANLVLPFTDAGVPVFMSGQTIGPLGINKEHDDIAKKIIEAVDVLTVRDKKYSKEYIDKIGAKPKRLVETADDAVNLQYSDDIPGLVSRFIDENTVAVNLTRYTADNATKMNTLVKIVKELTFNNKHKVLLIPHAPYDFRKLAQIYTQFSENVMLVDGKTMRGADMKAIISKCKAAIGGRYHFIVFCLATGVPVVGMAGNHYSYIKQRGCADQIDKGHYILDERKCSVDNVLRVFNTIQNDTLPKFPNTVSFDVFNEWVKGVPVNETN